jgi:hypothetical protein
MVDLVVVDHIYLDQERNLLVQELQVKVTTVAHLMALILVLVAVVELAQ